MKIWNQILAFFFKIIQHFWPKTQPVTLIIDSRWLNRKVFVDLYIPPAYQMVWSLLLLNDGQDGKKLKLGRTHHRFCIRKNSLLIAAIHAGNRMQEYGTANKPDYKKRGKKSKAYQDFILLELLPLLHKRYPISAEPQKVSIAGFSLGALSALDLAWSYPKVFGIVGAFSASLWWRSKKFDPINPDANRIIHNTFKLGKKRNQRFWFQAGTLDEKEDRNNNGIIDSIDDTLQLIKILEQKLPVGKFSLDYLEVKRGKHEPKTWKKVIPNFLSWAYTIEMKDQQSLDAGLKK